MVPNMVKLIKEGYTQRETADYLNISQSVVCRHLQKLNGGNQIVLSPLWLDFSTPIYR